MATYVLVHGSFVGSWCWKDVARLLRTAGHDAYAPAQNAAQVCISFPPVTGHTAPLVGDPVQVTVTVNYRWLKYVSTKLNLGTTTIRGKAAMRLEGSPTNFAAGCYP